MDKVKVGVVGYGTIGQRLADGVALQGDMELVGVADVAPTLAIRALKEKGMPYALYLSMEDHRAEFDALDIPVSGTITDLIQQCDVLLDATNAGVGAKNRALYEQYGKKAIFQGGEKNDVADVFFHGYANFEKGVEKQFLKLTSCNTTGLIRAVDCLDRAYGMERVAITIVRRVADPGDYHRGLTNAVIARSVFSHLVGSDSQQFDSFTRRQIEMFEKASMELQEAFPHKILRHICNSAGIERFPGRSEEHTSELQSR